MPDYTSTEAAQYLSARGFTVHSKRDGTDRPPPSELIKRWCIRGKIKARKSGWVWLISRDELDRILETSVATNVAGNQGAGDTPHHKD
jgi:hypothetical protein